MTFIFNFYMKYIFFVFLVFSGFASASINFRVDSLCGENVPGNKQIEMTVTAEWPQGRKTYVIYKPTMPGVSGLSLSEHISFGETLTLGSQTIQRVIHLYKFSITNKPGEIAETGNIFVDYRDASKEDVQHKQLSGISFKVIPPENNFLISGIIGALSAAVIGAAIIFVTRRKKKVPEKFSGPVIETGFLKKLNNIKRIRMDGNIPLYFQELENLLRDYFREKYNIGSLEDWNTSSNSSAGPDKKTMAVIIELLKLSRDVRYAGMIPNSHDQDRIFDFLKKTFTKSLPKQPLKEDELYLKE